MRNFMRKSAKFLSDTFLYVRDYTSTIYIKKFAKHELEDAEQLEIQLILRLRDVREKKSRLQNIIFGTVLA